MKSFFTILFSIFILIVSGQTISSKKWTDLFSYNNILAIREDHGKIIAATENGIFYYTIATGEITKLSKVNGLHEVKITAFDYNPDTKIGLVGYKNGSLDIITPNEIKLSVDIPIATGYVGDKRINNISITGNNAVISTGYGVSIFKLKEQEFGSSTFFSTNGTYEKVNEATILGNTVFAVTNGGLKSHDMNITFPVFSTWTVNETGSYNNIASNSIVAYSTINQVKYGNGTTFATLSQTFSSVQDVVITTQNIIVADNNRIYVYDLSGNYVSALQVGEPINTANFIGNKIFAGTKLSGVLNENLVSYKPDGPYSNFSYRISLFGNQILVSSGGYDNFLFPIYRSLGYYHFDGTKWIYPDYFKNNPIAFNVMDVVADPSKPTDFYFANFSFNLNEKGIYKMENNVFKKVYKNSDSNQFLNRPTGLTFDENNNLIVATNIIDNPLKRTGYYLYNRSADDFVLMPIINIGGSQKPLTKDGILYIPCPFFSDGGLLMMDYGTNITGTNNPVKLIKQENNLQTNGIVSVAVDNDDEVWIGGREGLRILSNPKSAITDPSPQTKPIIIEQNGIGEELFRDGQILAIEVDSGNQKWVSVDGGGVFYLSANGEKTFLNFTKSNSPLPTDNVTDIKVDNKNGKVYFATLDGIVVYQGDAVDVNSNFGNVLVYPNPVVTANYKGNVHIRGLAEKTNIRITDAVGNLVHQAIARGGFYEWNLNNLRGNRVASGIYYVLMTNEDATDKATAKIAVVN